MEEQVYAQLYAMEDRHWWFRGRREVISTLLGRAPVPSRPRILDAGCGTGRTLQDLAKLGEAVGVDPSPDAVEFCRRRGLENVREAVLEDLPFEAGSFDLLLACDVLEHLDDDLVGLRELRRVSAPHGTLLVTVPAYRWLWSSHDDSHHHRRRYTRAMLLDHARRSGWQPRFATYFNSLLLPPIAAVRMLERVRRPAVRSDYELTPGALNGLLEWPMRLEARAIARGVRFPAGVSVGLICTA